MVNKMSLPAFTAEASLYKAKAEYKSLQRPSLQSSNNMILPARAIDPAQKRVIKIMKDVSCLAAGFGPYALAIAGPTCVGMMIADWASD